MKKMLVALLCLQLCLLNAAFSESDSPPRRFVPPTPAPKSSEEPAAPENHGGLRLTVDGKTTALDFDPNPIFSQIQDGSVQASFFSDLSADPLYELYLLFPDGVQSGSKVTSDDPPRSADDGSGLMLFVTDASSNKCFIASQGGGSTYPADSSYSIEFSEVSASDGSFTYVGNLSGTLSAIDSSYAPLGETMTVTAEFRFTIGSAPAADLPELPDEKDAPPQPTPPPELPVPDLPPTPPAHLIPPANAKKI